MAVTWTVQTVAKVPGLANLPTDQAATLTGDLETAFDFDVPAGTTKSVSFGSVSHTALIAYVFHSSATPITLNTNAVDATGGNSFALGAGKAIEWDNTQPAASQITHDVTALYAINAGTKTTTVRVAFLSNV